MPRPDAAPALRPWLLSGLLLGALLLGRAAPAQTETSYGSDTPPPVDFVAEPSPTPERSRAYQRRMRQLERDKKLQELVDQARERLQDEKEQEQQEEIQDQIDEVRQAEGEEPQATPDPDAPELVEIEYSARAKGGPPVVMMLRPFNQVLAEGERFTTMVAVYSEDQQSYDGFQVRLRFPPLEVRPERVFDFPLEGRLDPENPPEWSVEGGLLHYRARFDTMQTMRGEVPLIYIAWRALSATERAELALGERYRSADPERSAVWLEDQNLLELKSSVANATMNAEVVVLAERMAEDRPGLTVWLEGEAPRALVEKVEQGARVGLELRGPDTPPRPGEEFLMEVWLHNPHHLAIDDLRLSMRYDRERLRILDWDYQGWIRRGVNLFDAHAHDRYPFDLHKRNSVLQHMGRVFYEMGFTEYRVPPSGSLVRIRCQALAPGAEHALELFPPSTASMPGTDVMLRSVSVLARPGDGESASPPAEASAASDDGAL